MAAPSPSEIAYEEAHIGDSRQLGIAISNGVCYGVAVVAVLLRLVSRRLSQAGNRVDDWWAWIGLLSMTFYIASYQIIVHYGLGRHSIIITNLKGFIISSTIAAVFYNFTILAIKLSILYFYRRIFPQRWFKYALLTNGALITGSAVSSMFCDVLQCVPLQSQWDPTVKGHCIDFSSVILASGIVNVITDFTLLILPMPVLWRLKVSQSRKRLVMSTFMLGGFVCVISTVRLFYVRAFKGVDPSWGDINTTELSTVEIGIGMLSACLPAYRPLWNHFFHPKGTVNASKQAPMDRSIKLTGVSKKWNGHSEISGSEDEERLYTRFGTVGVAQGDENISHDGHDRDIVVTRQFAISSTRDGF